MEIKATMKKILLTIFATVLCFSTLNKAYGFVRYEEKHPKKTILVNVSGVVHYEPFGWEEKNISVKLSGYRTVFKPILDILAADVNADLRYKTYFKNVEAAMKEVRKNDIDLFLGAYSKTELYKGLHFLYPAVLYNPITVFMMPNRIDEVKSTDDLKKLKGVRIVSELFSDFVDKKVSELNPIEVNTPYEAFEKLFTREADYIITSYYSGMVEAIKLGLLQQIAPAKQTLWKIPMFIGVGKASIYRDKLSKRITKYLTDEKNLKAVEDHLQQLIKDLEKKYEGVVPPTFVSFKDTDTQVTSSDNAQ